MERGRGLWKKALSLVLSLAMVLTLMPAQFAYAVEGEGSGDSGNTEEETMPEKLMYFSFDEDITDGITVGDKPLKAEIVTRDDAANTQHVAELSKNVSKVGGGALRLNNVQSGKEIVENDNTKGAYLKVPAGALKNADGSGKKAMTVSYWSYVPTTTTKLAGHGWVYFASEADRSGNDCKYVGTFDHSGKLRAECYVGRTDNWERFGADIEFGCQCYECGQVETCHSSHE